MHLMQQNPQNMLEEAQKQVTQTLILNPSVIHQWDSKVVRFSFLGGLVWNVRLCAGGVLSCVLRFIPCNKNKKYSRSKSQLWYLSLPLLHSTLTHTQGSLNPWLAGKRHRHTEQICQFCTHVWQQIRHLSALCVKVHLDCECAVCLSSVNGLKCAHLVFLCTKAFTGNWFVAWFRFKLGPNGVQI